MIVLEIRVGGGYSTILQNAADNMGAPGTDGLLYLPYILFRLFQQGHRLRLLWRCDQAHSLGILHKGHYINGIRITPVLVPEELPGSAEDMGRTQCDHRYRADQFFRGYLRHQSPSLY